MPPTVGSRLTILVVDNEPAVLNLVKLILEAAITRFLLLAMAGKPWLL
jgi:hypothetical protein